MTKKEREEIRAQAEASDWWCPSCKEALPCDRVTNQERCDTCGNCVLNTDKNSTLIRLLDDIEMLENEIARLKKIAHDACARAAIEEV